jgi:hypothetical protein
MKGRIESRLLPSNPRHHVRDGRGRHQSEPAPRGQRLRLRTGLYRSADGGKTWERTATDNVRPFYYSQVRVHPTNPDRVWFSSTPVKVSDEGGKTPRNATVGLHVDHHAQWIDPKDPNRHIVGNDGGIGITFDNGGNYIFPNTFAIGQFYNISFDMAVPYRVCGGLQDNGSWCGPSRRRQGAITNAMWFTFNGGDGFVTQQDPTDPNIIYAESQGGNMGAIRFGRPAHRARASRTTATQYMKWEDSIMAVRGDTTRRKPRPCAHASPSCARSRRRTPRICRCAGTGTRPSSSRRTTRGPLHGRQPRDEVAPSAATTCTRSRATLVRRSE